MNPSPARRLQALVIAVALLFYGLPQIHAEVPQLLNYQGRVTFGGVNVDKPGAFKFSLVDGGVDQSVAAAATVVINDQGTVKRIDLTNPGAGYLTPPTIRIEGTGDRAEAVAVMDGDRVDSITITNPGTGYSQVTPTLAIISPPPQNLKVTTFWSNDGTGVNGKDPDTSVQLDVRKGLYSIMLGQEGMQPLPSNVFSNKDVRLRVWFNPDPGDPGNFTLLTPDQRIAAVGYALMADAVKPGGITSEMLAGNAVTMAQLAPDVREALQSLQAWQATQLPVVTSPLLIYGAVDYPLSYQITATGSPGGFAATGLPAGWTVNTSTGEVSGTPSALGTITFNVSATNVAGTSLAKMVTLNVTGGVYVDYATGADGNPGTAAAPVKTITQGLAIATGGVNLRPVLVSGAAQPLSATLVLPDGAQIKGGFDRAGGWTRTAPRTPVTFAPATLPSTGSTRTAVSAAGLTKAVLMDGFAITTGGAIGNRSASLAGVVVKDCLSVTLSNNTITAGGGSPGLAGQAGTTAANGGWGAAGQNSTKEIGGVTYANEASGGAGGSGGGDIGNGGSGGAGWRFQWPNGVPAVSGQNGSSGGGTLLSPGASGGAGGAAGTSGAGAVTNGAPGLPGSPGADGSHGPVARTTPALADAFLPATGGNGSTGRHGGGGGGGGGGTDSGSGFSAGGGGGGGGGGSGAGGGLGGAGGGGSFGVVVVRSAVRITGCQLNTGDGGDGGNGGSGLTGGTGGAGGPGFILPGQTNGRGGNGGTGGRGGAGGGGAGGAGGPSIGLLAGANSTLVESGNTFTTGNGGGGGSGGARPGTVTTFAPAGPAGLSQNILTGVQP